MAPKWCSSLMVLDDDVTADNPVRFLEALVAQLDLGALGFQRSVPADTGRPDYDPGDLLRLYLYGYLHWIRSSWRLGTGDPPQYRANVAAATADSFASAAPIVGSP